VFHHLGMLAINDYMLDQSTPGLLYQLVVDEVISEYDVYATEFLI